AERCLAAACRRASQWDRGAAGAVAPTRRAGATATRRVGVAAACRRASTRSIIPTPAEPGPADIPAAIAVPRAITGTIRATTAINSRRTEEPGLRGRAFRLRRLSRRSALPQYQAIFPEAQESPMSLFDLSGRVAVVTGGNGGIGLGMAKGLAIAGAA